MTYNAVRTRAVLPFFLARLSALPADLMDGLRDASLTSSLGGLLALDAQLNAARNAVSGVMHIAVGRQTGRKERNLLLQARRRLYKGLELSEQSRQAVVQALTNVEMRLITRFEGLIRARESAAIQLQRFYPTSLRAIRNGFRLAMSDKRFLNGVMLSSPTLFRNVERYRHGIESRLDSRGEHIERGLLRYFTRTSMKATPFATFCTVTPGVMSDDGSIERRRQPIEVRGALSRQVSHARLNKRLYAVLWPHLRARAGVRATLMLGLNPTLQTDRGAWLFLSGNSGREIFQRLGKNRGIDLIEQLVRERSNVTFRDLAAALEADTRVEATQAEAVGYIDSLIEVGFLSFRSVVPEQVVDWDIPLVAMLYATDDAHAQIVVRLLSQLRSNVDAYRTADVDTRGNVVNEMRESIRATLRELGLPAHLWYDQPLFEDATADAVIDVSVNTDVEAAFDCLTSYIALTNSISLHRIQQATLRHFFDSYYDAQEATPLLRFYEDFYREHQKGHVERERDLRKGANGDGTTYDLGNPFNLDQIRRIQLAQRRISDCFREEWLKDTGANEVDVGLESIRKALVGIPHLKSHRSVSLFCQLVPTTITNAARLIMPSGTYHLGYGKFFSRFLYLLPPEMSQWTREANAGITDSTLAEISDDGDFNANLHPPLVEWNISYPTSEFPSLDGQISCADLDVVPDIEDPFALNLKHRATGQRVIPLDLGFLSPMRRPPLHQLLLRFAPASTYSVGLPDTPERVDAASMRNQGESNASLRDPQITVRPRMTLGSRIVVARRRWSIPQSLFPRQLHSEQDHEHFIRVNCWRQQYGIPSQVYVRIRPLPRPATVSQATREAPEIAVAQRESHTVILRATTQADVAGSPLAAHDLPIALSGTTDSLPIVNSTTRTETDVDKAAATVDAIEERTEEDTSDVELEAADAHDGVESEIEAILDTPQGATMQPRSSRDFWKPQFIDFENPLLVKLFGKLPSTLDKFVAFIEERYPDATALPVTPEGRHAIEFVLQVSVSPASEPQSACASETGDD